MMNRNYLIELFAGALIPLALQGCATSDINVNDSHAATPSFRMSVDLSNDEIKSPATLHTGNAIEFGVAQVSSSADQTLITGDSPVIWNGTIFTAPNQLQNKLKLGYADIAWRGRKFFRRDTLGLEWIVGVGYASANLDVASATQQASKRVNTSGIEGGIGLVWRMMPATSLHLRGTGYASNRSGVRSVGRYELFLAQALGDHVDLHAGYTKWSGAGWGDGADSDFYFTVAGPAVELDLCF